MIFEDVWIISGSILVSILLYLHYFFYYSTYSYWQRKNVRGPTPLPLVGNSLSFLFFFNFDVHREWYKKYGQIFGYYHGSTPFLSIGVPKLARQILVKDCADYFPDHYPACSVGHPVLDDNITYTHGENWKKIRLQFASAMSPQRIRQIVPGVVSSFQGRLDTLSAELDKAGKAGRVIDMSYMMALISSDMIWNTMLTKQIEPSEEKEVVACTRQLFARTTWDYALSIFFPFFFRSPLFIKDAAEDLIKTTRRVIEDRRGDPALGTYDDFTDRMIGSRENPDEKKQFTESELVSQVALTVASSENFAASLGLLFVELANNPKVQEKLYNEIKTVTSDPEALLQLPYLDATVKEGMRLYPGDYALNRTAAREYKLPDTDIVIPKGMRITIPLCAFQTDPEIFEDPFAFKPERFIEEKFDPDAYMPFGNGPRTCAGKSFAGIGLKLIVAEFLNKFKVSNLQDLKLSHNHFITFTPTRAFMQVTKRELHIMK